MSDSKSTEETLREKIEWALADPRPTPAGRDIPNTPVFQGQVDRVLQLFDQELSSRIEEARQSSANMYQKELNHWKRTAELFLEREHFKMTEHIFCTGCGKKLMEGKPLTLNN